MSDDRRSQSFGRRRADNKWPRLARDFWLLVVTAIVLFSLHSISNETKSRTAAIQAQRRQSVTDNCQAQNMRHDATILQLDRELLRALGGHPAPKATDAQLQAQFVRLLARSRSAQATQLGESRSFTVLLIDALAPKQDCALVVRAALTTGPNATLGPKPRH